MKHKKAQRKLQSYRSYLFSYKRKRSEIMFEWLKKEFCKLHGIPYNE